VAYPAAFIDRGSVSSPPFGLVACSALGAVIVGSVVSFAECFELPWCAGFRRNCVLLIAGLPSRKALAGCVASWRTVRSHFVPFLVIHTADVAARTKVARKGVNHPAESETVENNCFVLDAVYVSISWLSELQPRPKL
jgi:hypothetical protein